MELAHGLGLRSSTGVYYRAEPALSYHQLVLFARLLEFGALLGGICRYLVDIIMSRGRAGERGSDLIYLFQASIAYQQGPRSSLTYVSLFLPRYAV